MVVSRKQKNHFYLSIRTTETRWLVGVMHPRAYYDSTTELILYIQFSLWDIIQEIIKFFSSLLKKNLECRFVRKTQKYIFE